jgi:5'-phosphate synthase pdxT subunit
VTIGVLALQGDVREHLHALADLGEVGRLVRGPADLEGLSGIILPGGESTTLSILLESSRLFDPLAAALGGGLPAFGTCAGMILLADTVLDGRPDQKGFGVIGMTVRRNGYGRQVASFECDLDINGLGEPPVHAVFIRAPVVEATSPGVEVLATLPDGAEPDGPSRRGTGGGPVVCRQGPVLVTAFHPELTGDRRLHQLFVGMTKENMTNEDDQDNIKEGKEER